MKAPPLWLCGLLALLACSEGSPAPPTRAPAADSTPSPAATSVHQAEIDDLQRQLREKDEAIAKLQTRVELLELAAEVPLDGEASEGLMAELEGRLSDLERERAYWEAESRKYRAGLERAVEELNRQSASAQITVPAPSPPPSRSPDPGRISQYWPPRVTLVTPDSVTVEGKLWNSGDESRRVTLDIVLLFDGAEVERKTQLETVPARAAVEYSTTFNPRQRGPGKWSARTEVR